jgi:hypothetical protein
MVCEPFEHVVFGVQLLETAQFMTPLAPGPHTGRHRKALSDTFTRVQGAHRQLLFMSAVTLLPKVGPLGCLQPRYNPVSEWYGPAPPRVQHVLRQRRAGLGV